jgi:hypothetical protein
MKQRFLNTLEQATNKGALGFWLKVTWRTDPAA